MTLRQLRALALKYAPLKGRFPPSFWKRADEDEPWLPGHELAHAFVADDWQWHQRRFGIPHRVLTCTCIERDCHEQEAAAMMVSVAWSYACGRPDVVEIERVATAGLALIELPAMQTRAKSRLRACGLWPIPLTVPAIRAYEIGRAHV